VGGLLPLTRSPVFVADMGSDPRTRVIHEAATREGIRSMMLVPLVTRDVVVAALALYHDVVYSYDAGEVAQVRALADQVALALAGAALHQQTLRQLAQLRALDAVQRAVSDPGSDPGNERVRCGSATQAIVSGGGATRAWVFHVRGSELDLVASAGATALADDASRAAARAALDAGKVLTHAGGTDVLVAAPIAHQGRVLGALVLAPPRPPHIEPGRGTLIVQASEDRELPQARHEFASTAAGQLAVAIANARLYDEARAMSVQLQAVIAAMPDGIIVFDRNDRVVFYNRKMTEAYGLEGVDLTGWTPADFVREISACLADPNVALEIARRVQGEERSRVHRIEFELVRPRRRVIERISAPVLAPDGSSFGQVVMYHDLTERM
jgi:PAS domain S-box-containing protein